MLRLMGNAVKHLLLEKRKGDEKKDDAGNKKTDISERKEYL